MSEQNIHVSDASPEKNLQFDQWFYVQKLFGAAADTMIGNIMELIEMLGLPPAQEASLKSRIKKEIRGAIDSEVDFIYRWNTDKREEQNIPPKLNA